MSKDSEPVFTILTEKDFKEIRVPPPLIAFYGEPKIGKTTLAAQFPKPIIIWTERGAAAIKVPKLPVHNPARSWNEVLGSIRVLLREDHDRQTVVLDTLDVAEKLCKEHVIQTEFEGSHAKYMSYYKGPPVFRAEFKRLLDGLELLRDRKNMTVIVIAHDGLQKGSNMLGEDYKKFAGNLSDRECWTMVRDWVDMLGHACKELYVEDGKARQVGTGRWLVFEGSPARDAGGRAGYEMPAKIQLSYEEFAKHFKLTL